MSKKIKIYHLLLLFITLFLNRVDAQDNTIVVTLKQEYKNAKINNPQIERIFQLLEITHYKPMFGFLTQDNPHRKKHTVDISNMYELKYEADLEITDAIGLLKKTGLYISVEPKYPDKLYYQPNDPKADSTLPASGGNFKQNQLLKHKLYQAWDITKGDSKITIGILDTGIQFDHEDLGNIAYNTNDSINGIDDDGDMALDSFLLDNFRGWDVSDWDNDPTLTTDGHGTQVAGCSSGQCENGVGVCGTGFYCRYLPIKVSHDSTNSIISEGYSGIIYAAQQGCDIINLSWGSEGPGAYMFWQQNIINYAAIDYDVVIIASAGNTGGCYNFYPASYDNVVSVATTKFNDQLAGTSTYSYYVDVNALGVNAHTTQPTGPANYGPSTGSSFAAPTVAGVAGLIRSKRPELNSLQVGELIRVTGDQNDDNPANTAGIEKMGKSLNAYNAVTDSVSTSVRTINWQFEKTDSLSPVDGDTLLLALDFQNYLAPINDLSITASNVTSNFSIISDSIFIGHLGTLDTANNLSSPFLLSIAPGTNLYDSLLIRIEYKGAGYLDYQYIYLPLWESYRDTITQKTTYLSSNIEACGGELTFSGDSVSFDLEIANNLRSSSNLNGVLSPISGNITVYQSESYYGDASKFDTLINTIPFKFYLGAGYAHGDSLKFQLTINSDDYNETYLVYHILDTNNIDTLDNYIQNLQNTFSNSSGSFTFAGDTLLMSTEVLNHHCDIIPFQVKLQSISANTSIIDSVWNVGLFNAGDTISSHDSIFKFVIDASANTGDSVYLLLTYSDGLWFTNDSILLVLDDSNLNIITDSKTNHIKDIFQVRPNPFNGWINITTQNTSNLPIEYIVYNALFQIQDTGQMVSLGGTNDQFTINTQHFKNGYYILFLKQGELAQQIKLVKIGH